MTSDDVAPPLAAAPYARFTALGRCADPRALRVKLEPLAGPLAPAEFEAAAERALAAWSATGVVGFVRVKERPYDVVLGWRRGAHDACTKFGTDTRVAHTGPVGSPSFVHFDADREWSVDGGAGHGLFQTALHELGHVLGLGHSDDEAALMYPLVDPRRDALGASDRAGLASLYGGGADGPADLVVLRADGARAAVLRGVAPPDVSGYALFDSDGDGRDELCVWRTDVAGYGELMQWTFDDDLRLLRSIGPRLAVVAPRAAVTLGVTSAGERVIVSERTDGSHVARRFGAGGALAVYEGELPGVRADPCAGDLNGDGSVERIARP